jgi:uncharacterized protein YjbI with pentapeptide repeats
MAPDSDPSTPSATSGDPTPSKAAGEHAVSHGGGATANGQAGANGAASVNGSTALTLEAEGDAPLTAGRGTILGQPSSSTALLWLGGVVALVMGFVFNANWLILAGALITLSISWRLLWPSLQRLLAEFSTQQQVLLIAVPTFFLGAFGLMQAVGVNRAILTWGQGLRWDVIGALGDFLGAIGQIFVAMLALYVAWRQYVISRDLTTQQNRITQQQTIDAYFQGISDLVLDDEGLLEDWPQERIIAEARTAAILGSVDAPGKAKVIRFLSRSRLLSPLKRDRHLGRPILDGAGGYAEDRAAGVRVVDLGAVLAGADLAGSDLRWTDLSEANLVRADLSGCDLVRANLSRTILYRALLAQADLMNAQFFYGDLETASPRSRTEPPDYTTGAYTGAVVEGADFSQVKRLSEAQRQYCCRWGGGVHPAYHPWWL